MEMLSAISRAAPYLHECLYPLGTGKTVAISRQSLRRALRRARRPKLAVQSNGQRSKEAVMTQKIIEVVGTSKESFAKAAENAVSEAAKTVRGMKWARVAELEMELDGKKIVKYRTTTKIYFDVEK
jgi:flavin-binding protein dodecin